MESSEKPKTDAQRNAEHLWFRKAAKCLNDNGIEQYVVIQALTTKGLETQWTGDSFKHNVYKPVLAKVSGGKTSTEDESTTDPDICVQGITKWVAQEYGLALPAFPDRFTQAEEKAQ